MPLAVGQPAPNFTLFNSAKQPVHLADYRGHKVLLLFFPLAFTSVCTAELCAVRDDIGRYNSLGVTVFGISTDSLFTLAKFREEQGLNFELLSDYNKDVSTAYDSLYTKFGFDMQGVSKRSAFVIDEAGTIRYAEVLENAGEQPNFDAIQEVIAPKN